MHDLEPFQDNPSKFMRPFITDDEIWIHNYTLETKEQYNNG